MRKGLMFLFGIISFLGINTVSAETDVIDFYSSDSDDLTYESLNNDQTLSILENKFYDVIDEILDEHNHTYYIMKVGVSGDSEPYFVVYSYDTSFVNYSSLVSYSKNNDITCTYYILQSDNSFRIATEYYPLSTGFSSPFPFDIDRFEYFPSNFYLSNMEIPYNSSNIANIYIDEELFFTLNSGDIIPTYKNIVDPPINSYTSIDLNQYSYVALSLKNYSVTNTYYTNVYVKGNYCLTAVYNYGMAEKKDIISGSKNERCSIYYDDFTLVRTYLLEQDIKNHAIYYLKAYDTSKENVVKIDTSVFDITYITEENKDNPYVTILGKTYPTIAYDNLTDSATISEDEDYISGVSCQVGDFNCYNEYNPSNIFNDLFDKPLEMLKSVWSAIVSIFTLITEFILLLPPTMQGFLYIAFGISIILGIIKILL